MSFTPLIPVNGQSLGSSRTEVSNNFASLRSTLAENHVDVNATNPGLHTYADLLAQSANSNPITGCVSHYSKVVGGVTEWFFQRENSGVVIQMSVGNPVTANPGTTFLPGGLILKFGNLVPGSSGATVTFRTAFPNAVLSLNVTPNSNSPSSSISTVSSVTTSNFSIYTTVPGVTHFYTAVGY